MGQAGFLTTTSQPIFPLREKMRLGGLTLRPTPLFIPHPCAIAREPCRRRRQGPRSRLRSLQGKVYCIPHKPPAHGGGLWGLRTAPYSPPLFLLCKKKGGLLDAPHRHGLAAVAPAPSVAAGGNGPLLLKAFNPRLQPFLQICKNGLLNSRKNAPGQRFHDVPVSLHPTFYDERHDALI